MRLKPVTLIFKLRQAVTQGLAEAFLHGGKVNVEARGDITLLHTVKAVQDEHLPSEQGKLAQRCIYAGERLLSGQNSFGEKVRMLVFRHAVLGETRARGRVPIVVCKCVTGGLKKVSTEIANGFRRIAAQQIFDDRLKHILSGVGAAQFASKVILDFATVHLESLRERSLTVRLLKHNTRLKSSSPERSTK